MPSAVSTPPLCTIFYICPHLLLPLAAYSPHNIQKELSMKKNLTLLLVLETNCLVQPPWKTDWQYLLQVNCRSSLWFSNYTSRYRLKRTAHKYYPLKDMFSTFTVMQCIGIPEWKQPKCLCIRSYHRISYNYFFISVFKIFTGNAVVWYNYIL